MSDVILPPIPPLPPPVGSAVRPSVSAGSPPPPTGPPPAPVASTDAADDRYLPPEWLDKQRGNGRTSTLNPKVVILSVVGIGAAFFATVVVLIVLAGTTESRFVEIPLDDTEQPASFDNDQLVDSMGARSAGVDDAPVPRPA